MGDLDNPPQLSDVEQQLLQRDRQLQAVVSMTHALQTHVMLDDLIRQAVLTSMATVDADACSLLLHDRDRKLLIFRHVEGAAKAVLTGVEISDAQGIAGAVFHSGIPRISHDVKTDRSHSGAIDAKTNYHTSSMVTVPLRAGGEEAIGVLQALNKHSGTFDEHDIAVLQVLSTQVAAAIITAQLNERAKAVTIVELMGQISHDIKNLLTPVSMAGQTLRLMLEDFSLHVREKLATSSPENAAVVDAIQLMISNIDEDAKEMLDILDESAQIAQLRAKEIADSVKGLTSPPEYSEADLNDVMQGVCRVLRVVAEQHGVSLREELGTLPIARLDTRRLYNAAYNLVNNALGATPAGGSVTVRTGFRRGGDFPEGNYVQMSVADTGHGMPPETANILFSGRVRSTKAGGTGLGTLVVRNVIDAHGGQLFVDSEQEKGTTITARIPLREAGE